MRTFFVTGTGTEVGKTWITEALLWAARGRGLRTVALKPVAAGCEKTSKGLRNDDALALQRAMTEPLAYEAINPVALEMPIAPHIAASQAGVAIQAADLARHCLAVLEHPHDFALIEGAGGWRVPLNNNKETMADLAITLGSPVILVVGMGLGCLSNALLTAEAIRADGLELAGWVANTPGETMPFLSENLATLAAILPAPCLGQVPNVPGADAAARYLDLDVLLS